jgi:hypothetical protein
MRKSEEELQSEVQPSTISGETLRNHDAFMEAVSRACDPVLSGGTRMLLEFLEEVRELKDLASREDDKSNIRRYAEDLALLDELLEGETGCPVILEFPDDEREKIEVRELIVHGPVETFIKNKWDTLCKVHGLNTRILGFLVENTTPPKTLVLDGPNRKILETLAGMFADGASKYPGLAHKVMSWPITRYMPRPPKDEFPDFTFSKVSRDLPYTWGTGPTIQVLTTRETLTTSWLVFHPKANWDADIGRQRFMSLAKEAGEIVGRILPDCPIWEPTGLAAFYYCNLWLQTMHLLRRTCRHDDGWDGLFDDDSDFWDEAWRKGLYKFWKSDDVFLDSALACNTLLAGDYQRVREDIKNHLQQAEKPNEPANGQVLPFDIPVLIERLKMLRSALDSGDEDLIGRARNNLGRYVGSAERLYEALQEPLRGSTADAIERLKWVGDARKGRTNTGLYPALLDALATPEFIAELERWQAQRSETPADDEQDETSNTLEEGSGFWTLTFHGKKLPAVQGREAFAYLGHILTHPKEWIPATQVAEVAHAPTSAEQRRPPEIMDQEDGREENGPLSRKGIRYQDSENKADRRYLEECYETLSGLRADQQRAKDNGDEASADECQQKIDGITGELKGLTGPGGRLQKFANEVDRAYSAVQKAVKRVMNKVQRHSPELHQHLKNCIHFDKPCISYRPETRTEWDWIKPQREKS